MTNIKKLSICILFVVDICSLLLAQTQMQTEQNDIQTKQTKRQMQILKGDYEAAKQSLLEAAAAKDKATVKVALKQRRFGPGFQSDAVNAVKQINDKDFVSDLIEVLENNQNIAWRGGSEVKFLQKQLNKTITSTLEVLTGLKFGTSEDLTPQEIEIVLEVSREWFKTHISVINQKVTPILSKDFAVAEEALNQAIEQKDKEALRKGLKNQIFFPWERTSEKLIRAVVKMKDVTFVPNLIEVLQQNQSIIAGGGEIVASQLILDRTLINALKELTGLDFEISNFSLKSIDDTKKHRNEIEEIIKQSLGWVKTHKAETQQTIKLEEQINQQEDSISSKDYAVAEKALNKAILEKDKKTIKLGLQSRYFPIRQKTVEAIANIKDETFVPNLIKSLQGNQGIIAGGTETEVMQNDLNEVIVSALQKLTKLKFKVSKPLSTEDINEVLDKSQDWYKFHKKDMK